MLKVKMCWAQSDLDSNCLRLFRQTFLILHFCTMTESPVYSILVWPYGLCQREPKVPGLYEKHMATEPIMSEMRLVAERLLDPNTF